MIAADKPNNINSSKLQPNRPDLLLLLFREMSSKRTSVAAIFKRGGQKTEYEADAAGEVDAADASRQLDQHLQQLSLAWAAPKTK